MSITRRLIAAAGAGLLLATSGIALAGSATADDNATPNPYKFSIPSTQTNYAPMSAAVDPSDAAVTCAAFGAWTAKVPGRQDAILVKDASCTGSLLTVQVAVNANSHKKNAVIKLVSTTNPGGTKVVKTFVVKVIGKTGNPGKGHKPA
jgi:hypothetical protein